MTIQNLIYWLEQWALMWWSVYDYSVTRTPHKSVVVQRRSKSKGYRQSYRGCIASASRLSLTAAMTQTPRRLCTSRRAPQSQNITVSQSRPRLSMFLSVIVEKNPNMLVSEWWFSLSSLCVEGEVEPRAAGLTGEDRVAAVLRYSPLSVQTHSAEQLLQAAVGVYRCREAARFGGGVGGTAEQLQSHLLRGAGDGRGGRWRRDHPHTGKHRIQCPSVRQWYVHVPCGYKVFLKHKNSLIKAASRFIHRA